MQKKILCYSVLSLLLFSCVGDGGYNYIDTTRVGASNPKLPNYNNDYPYRTYNYGYQGQYQPYSRPYSRGYKNIYANPPRNYYPYYDSDVYYVPPTYYYNAGPDNGISGSDDKI